MYTLFFSVDKLIKSIHVHVQKNKFQLPHDNHVLRGEGGEGPQSNYFLTANNRQEVNFLTYAASNLENTHVRDFKQLYQKSPSLTY